MASIQGLQAAQLRSYYYCKEPPASSCPLRNGFRKFGGAAMCRTPRSSSSRSFFFLYNSGSRRLVSSVHGFGSSQRCREFSLPVCCCLRSSPLEEQIEEEVEEIGKNPSTSSSSSTASSSTESSSRTEWQGGKPDRRKRLSTLDAYFDKLHGGNDVNGTSSSASSSLSNGAVSQTSQASEEAETATRTGSRTTDPDKEEARVSSQGLLALDAYFNKLHPPKVREVVQEESVEMAERKMEVASQAEIDTTTIEAREDAEKDEDEVLDYRELLEELQATLEKGVQQTDNNLPPHISQDPIWGLQAGDSYSYEVNTLVGVNLAVFLFGLASPQGVPGMGDASLPYLYGAKVNELIVDGEWWRLVTPMFLHSSLVHIGLSTWALLSFGPGVESAYGSVGFGMIYLIGGLFGNLMSFFHTPQGTVGGTGPIFAVMGTWLVYLLRNREIIGLEVADDMIRKLAIMTAITVAFCNSFPIDDWTHLGAGVVGIVFGLFTCPTVHVNVHLEEAASKSQNDSDDDAIDSYLLLNEALPPSRLLLVFALCLALFFSLYNLGMPIATEFHFLHGGISDENW